MLNAHNIRKVNQIKEGYVTYRIYLYIPTYNTLNNVSLLNIYACINRYIRSYVCKNTELRTLLKVLTALGIISVYKMFIYDEFTHI